MKLERLDELTYQAYQTVLVWALTKSKKGKMPKFETLKASSKAVRSQPQTHEQLEAMMHMMAARFGTTVKNPRLGKRRADGQ